MSEPITICLYFDADHERGEDDWTPADLEREVRAALAGLLRTFRSSLTLVDVESFTNASEPHH